MPCLYGKMADKNLNSIHLVCLNMHKSVITTLLWMNYHATIKYYVTLYSSKCSCFICSLLLRRSSCFISILVLTNIVVLNIYHLNRGEIGHSKIVKGVKTSFVEG